jgi:hypothetical protein
MAYVCECGRPLDLVAVLDALPRDGTTHSGLFSTKCAGCERSIEMRLRQGGYDVGYSYFGGSIHFEAVKEVRVKGLAVVPSDPDDLDVRLGERHWHFSYDRRGWQRFAILVAAFARGKRVAELELAQWQVTAGPVERGGAKLPAEEAGALREGDFLWLQGHDPALTRAWHYLNDGRGLDAPRR